MLNLFQHHIFLQKVINQITHRKNKLWRFLPVSRMSVSGIGTIPDKQQFKERVIDVLGDVTGGVYQIREEERLIIIEAADQTLAHMFDYLGSGKVQMPNIRWHEDFKSGSLWKKGVFYLKQRQSTTKGADIKVPWELSRCQHLLWLGEAYLLTKDERYSKEVIDEIEDWLNENPFMRSVNWTCTMDVAFRAVDWLYAVSMVMDSSNITDKFIKKFYRSLYQHGWHIFNNLEQIVPYSGNHLFSDLVGLLYLSFLFEGTKRGRSWKRYAISSLWHEIRCQVLPSGVHYERSVSYHRLMTEMVLASLFVLRRNNVRIPPDIRYRAETMLSYIRVYTKQNRLSPLIEDNDDGRFLPFCRRDFRCHDYLLDRFSTELLFLSAGVSIDEVKNSYSVSESAIMYSDAGHAVLKNEDAYLFVTNGEQSAYENSRKTVGSHTHNDKLSFEFSIGKDDVIVDPGAYIYTPMPEKSNEFRSTIKHNTIVVDEEEQNKITQKNVFLVTKNSRATLFGMPSQECIEGAYETFEGGLTHYRKFELSNAELTITDIVKKKGKEHHAILSFHLAENVKAETVGEAVVLTTNSYFVNLLFDGSCGKEIEVINDTISPSYGVLKDSKTVRIRFIFDTEIEVKIRLSWEKKK